MKRKYCLFFYYAISSISLIYFPDVYAALISSHVDQSAHTQGGFIDQPLKNQVTVNNPGCHEKAAKLFCNHAVLKKLDYLGEVSLKNTTIQGTFIVKGNVYAVHSHFHDVMIIGHFKSEKNNINGEVTIKEIN